MRFWAKICFLGTFLFLNTAFFAQAQTEQDSSNTFRGLEKDSTFTTDVKLIDPDWIFSKSDYRKKLTGNLKSLQNWDEVFALDGFTQGLGIIGKPYQNWISGFQSKYFLSNDFQNPVSNQHDIYMNPVIGYLDTKTPYVSINYAQGTRKSQMFRGIISMNFTPFWNVTAAYKRRTHQGTYPNNVVDHYNITFNSNFHSFNKKYHGFVSGNFTQLQDQMNGGTYQDGSLSFDQSFSKLVQAVNLYNAKLERGEKSAETQHFYNLFADSSNFQITLKAAGNASIFTYLFNDASSISSNSLYYYPYPQIFYDSTITQVDYSVEEYKADLGLNLSYEDGTNFGNNHLIKTSHSFTISQKNQIFHYLENDSLPTDSSSITNSEYLRKKNTEKIINIKGSVYNYFYPIGKLGISENYDIKFTNSSLFKNSFDISNNLRLYLTKSKEEIVQLPDSSPEKVENYTFFSIINKTTYTSKRPSFMQLFFDNNFYQGNSQLKNEKLFFTQVNFQIKHWKEKDPINEEKIDDEIFDIGGFFSQLSDPIVYDTLGNVLQFENENITKYGIKLHFRKRFGWFYLENKSTYLLGINPVDNSILKLYANNLPKLYGKAELYYKNTISSRKHLFRVGFAANYFTEYQAFQIHPATSEFYPQNDYTVPAYARLDFNISVRIKYATIFAQLYHLNENLPLPGYYTTPFYPMQERGFILGFRWNFYD